MHTGSEAAYLREQAARCRRLAGATNDEKASAALRLMADDYELKAAEIETPPESKIDGEAHHRMMPPEQE